MFFNLFYLLIGSAVSHCLMQEEIICKADSTGGDDAVKSVSNISLPLVLYRLP